MGNPDLVKHTKSFKKYTDEYRPELVDAVRTYASGRPGFSVHEDKSILKVTATKGEIDAMCVDLRGRFGPLPGDPVKK